MHIIAFENLLILFIPVALIVWILWKWSAGAKDAMIGLGRMVLQLVLIGYVLMFLFDAENPWIVLGVLTVMMLFASWIALRTYKSHRVELYGWALLAVMLGGGSTLFLVVIVVVRPDPLFAPRFVIPLAGMIFAAAMNSISLAIDRTISEMAAGKAFANARQVAYRAALIPIVNALFAVGLVSLPGMMTGQILSGVEPLIAVRYQIMVMAMMLSSAGLSAAAFLWLAQKRIVASVEQADDK